MQNWQKNEFGKRTNLAKEQIWQKNEFGSLFGNNFKVGNRCERFKFAWWLILQVIDWKEKEGKGERPKLAKERNKL